MSWYLGVKPARTTLSEEAMHSIMSFRIVFVSRISGLEGGSGGGSRERGRTATKICVDVVGFEEHCFAYS